MKHNYLKSLLLMLMMCVGMSAWAASIEINTKNSGITGSYADKTFKVDNVEFRFTQWMKNNNIQAKKSTTNSCYNVDAIPGTITKITVVQTGTARAIKMFGGTSAKPTGAITQPTTDATMVFDFSSENYTYFSMTTPGNACYITTITIEYEENGKTSTTTTFNGESAYIITLGDEFTAPTATVTGGTDLVPTYSSSNENVATVDAKSGNVSVVGAGSTTITASFAATETYNSSSASYTLTVKEPAKVYRGLEELVADNLTSGTEVTVKFSDVVIKSIYVTAGGYRNGVYFDIQKGGKDIEIYFQNVPEEWVAGGTLSGTMTCPWKNYNGTWELAPDSKSGWSWSELTYNAPAIAFTGNKTALEVGQYDVYAVTYDGDGELTATSSNEKVAEVVIVGGSVVVSAVGVGTTTIEIAAPATDNYFAASKSYKLTVTEPFDISKYVALVTEKDGKFYISSSVIEGTNKYFVAKEVAVLDGKVYGIYGNEAKDYAWKITSTGDNSATVQNAEDKYLSLSLSDKSSDVTLSENKVTLYTEDDVYYAKKDGRGFAYNKTYTRMAGYTVSSTYVAAKPMPFASVDDYLYVRKVTNGSYGTLCIPFKAKSNDIVGAEFYTISGIDGETINLTAATDLVAGQPYVFKATDSKLMIAFDTQNEIATAPIAGPYLTGVYGDVPAVKGSYVLQNQDDVVGFYQVMTAGVATVKANRAYLNVPSEVKAFTFAEDATAIKNIKIAGENMMYDLSGRRVNAAQKGLYIVNGKKVVK